MGLKERELELIGRQEKLYAQLREIMPTATTPLSPENVPDGRNPRWPEYLATKEALEGVKRELDDVRRRRGEGEV